MKIVSKIILLLLIICIAGCSQTATSTMTTDTKVTTNVTKGISIHYIDVGQGDCELIVDNGKTLLIDGGEAVNGPKIVKYIKSLGLSKIDFMIGTHPHSDHIGGLTDVVNAFPVGTIIMPKKTATTHEYINLIKAISSKNMKITAPVVGTKYTLDTATFTIIAPNGKDYVAVNDYSVVVKLDYKNSAFMFTGDAQKLSEKEILKNGINLKSDVLKMGHHGSNTSSSVAFLQAVNPKVAIISCGTNNQYGFPHKATMDNLSKMGIKVYRTDLNGTITVTSDGSKLSVATEKK